MLELRVYQYCLERYHFLKSRNVFIFGAGEFGGVTVNALLKLGIEVQHIIDNNLSKQGTMIEGIPVISLDNYIALNKTRPHILIALVHYEEVIIQLANARISQFTYDSIFKVLSEKDSNANLYNLLDEYVHKRLIDEYYDINLQMQKDALRETTNFVMENMFHVKQFATRFELIQFIFTQPCIKGNYLEFGVFEGASINFYSSLIPNEIVYGFDSFEGLPEDWFPGYEKGKFALNTLPEFNPNIQLVKGWFEDTLPGFLLSNNEVCAFIHIDCDLYSSTRTVFTKLKNRIVVGTVILFDEFFNYPNWKNGEYKAFMQLVEEQNLTFEYIGFVPRGSQVAVRITGTN